MVESTAGSGSISEIANYLVATGLSSFLKKMTIRFGTSSWRAVIADEVMAVRSPRPEEGYLSEWREKVLSKGCTLEPNYETPVGLRYIGESINEDKVIVGEASAGLSIKGHSPKKDGILACLLAAKAVASRSKGPEAGTGSRMRVGGIGKRLGGAS